MGWKVVDSANISNVRHAGKNYMAIIIQYWTDIYVTTEIDRVEAQLSRVSFSEGTYIHRTPGEIQRESGVKYRARFEGYFEGSYKNVSVVLLSSEQATPGLYSYKSEDIPGTNTEGSVNGTLYLEKYIPEPPSTPSSISVPSSIRVGDKFTVSWGSGLGATSYRLERSVNGGSYTQIYSGSSRSYSDTALASWDTVRYRVRSYNSDGYSSYKTSATIIIQHFPEFQMRVNGSLKTSDNGWVKVNGVLKEIDSMWVRINGTLKEV